MIHDIFFAVMYNMCAVMGGIDYSNSSLKRDDDADVSLAI